MHWLQWQKFLCVPLRWMLLKSEGHKCRNVTASLQYLYFFCLKVFDSVAFDKDYQLIFIKYLFRCKVYLWEIALSSMATWATCFLEDDILIVSFLNTLLKWTEITPRRPLIYQILWKGFLKIKNEETRPIGWPFYTGTKSPRLMPPSSKPISPDIYRFFHI